MRRLPDTKQLLGTGPGRRKRDTAEECHHKAKENLLAAGQMSAGNERTLLERSAAAWSLRAEKLEQDRTRFLARLLRPDPEAEHVRL
jgi:hypothetical protein